MSRTTAVTLPLFDTPAPVPVTKARSASMRSVAFGNCPGCRKGRVGILRGAVHLMWRHHTYTTWSGARLSCPASGVPVCQLTERAPTVLIQGRARCACETPPATTRTRGRS